MAQTQAQGAANLSMLNSMLLKKQTVLPNEWYGGAVTVQTPTVRDSAAQFSIDVTVGDEVHTFRFREEEKGG